MQITLFEVYLSLEITQTEILSVQSCKGMYIVVQKWVTDLKIQLKILNNWCMSVHFGQKYSS